MPEILKTSVLCFFSNSRHYAREFQIILCLDKMITQNAFCIKQNLTAYEALQPGTPAHGSHHFTVSSLKACWLWCVIMHHRANVSPVSQPLSTLSASTSQPSSTARARPHDDWGETVDCSFSPQSLGVELLMTPCEVYTTLSTSVKQSFTGLIDQTYCILGYRGELCSVRPALWKACTAKAIAVYTHLE